MIKSNSRDFERNFKRFLPQSVKALAIFLLVNRCIGYFIQKCCSRSLLGAKFNFSAVDPLVAARVYFGLWEGAEVRFYKKYVSDGDTIIELGSSIGVTLATLCSKCRIKTYIAVEASPTAGRILTETITYFPAVNIVKLDCAISYGVGATCKFQELSLTGSRLAEGENMQKGICHDVQVMQLNDIVSENIDISEKYSIDDQIALLKKSGFSFKE